ncbi:TetR/AcrR family transcriptional regulator [Saccharopolyspora sp. NPDC050389]|uniref:TetR/AcrR family transcriptional regulator n=1 Tax=Saccharopolyspora sp. NPDC050389 TaxID=3155516 RepID=UPI00340CF9D1
MRCVQCGTELAAAVRGRPRRYCSRSCQARAYRARKDGGGLNRRSTPRSERARGELDRATIVRSAIRLADGEGLAAVSMRAVAASNDVAAMALYRHVSGKDELVRAMVDVVLAEYRPPERNSCGWRAELEHQARQEWALYQRHPWVLSVLASTRPPLGGSVLALVDRSMTALAGHFDADTSLSVYLLVSGYVQGMALLLTAEEEAVRGTGVGYERWWSTRRDHLVGTAGGRYPWLAEVASEARLDDWFEFGLQRVLDGIGARL